VIVHTRDEVGDMALSFNRLQQEIGSAAAGLKGARRGLSQARSELKQMNEELRLRTNELQKANQELCAEFAARRQLEQEILDISEREQCRLGQDLHDGLGQQLAGIAYLGKVLADKLGAEAHESAQSAADIATHTAETIGTARILAKGLYPVELSRYGLLMALQDLTYQTSQRFQIGCELRQCGGELVMAKSAEIHIYRIIQESISNAIKHAKAYRIIVESQSTEGIHIFTVTDDGIGFEPPVRSSGMGLHLMQYRARVIGAQIHLEQPVNGGCRVTCRLPTGPTGLSGHLS
ncbi:MAG: sensor histidine kinase, partial [Luteolibacter sp.]